MAVHKIDVMEKIITDTMARTLGLRFDICRCQLCNDTIFKRLLEKFDPIYMDPTLPEYRKKLSEITAQHLRKIMEELIAAVDALIKNPPHVVEQDREEDFNHLLERVFQERGLDLSKYHRSILKRRVALRMRSLGVHSYRDYINLLGEKPSEYDKLFDVLTINVSEFFRDLPVWEGIRQVLRKVVLASQARKLPLRIWSAGCARGEEPYSLAIIIKEMQVSTPVEIFATDVDEDSIKMAMAGEYFSMSLRNVSAEQKEKYFIVTSHGKYRIKDEIKQTVIFKRHELINDSVLPNIDLILCRNVFIYFTKPLQEAILNKFYHALNDNGFLVIGRTEIILNEARLIFHGEDIEKRIYYKQIIR